MRVENIIVMSHDEVNKVIPYTLVYETMSSSKWNTTSVKKKFEAEFSEEERSEVRKLKAQAYSWYLVKGVPDEVRIPTETFDLWNKLAVFCLNI